jgi:Pilus assembly protein, PilO
MSKLPTSAKAAMVIVAVVVAIAVGWFGAIAPKRSEASKLGAQIDETRLQIAGAQHGGGTQVQPIRIADLFELSRAMPDRADMPSVLLQLSEVAAETGVNFQSITPHDPVQVGAYQQVDIDLVFEGHFYDLSDFLYRLRNLVGVHGGVLDATGRLFSVQAISFGEGDLKFPYVKASLTVSAYVFGDGTVTVEPTAPVAPQAGTTTTTPPAGGDSQPIPPAPTGSAAGAGAGA